LFGLATADIVILFTAIQQLVYQALCAYSEYVLHMLATRAGRAEGGSFPGLPAPKLYDNTMVLSSSNKIDAMLLLLLVSTFPEGWLKKEGSGS